MKHLFNRLITFLKILQSRIAFYPTLLALMGFLLAFIMMYLEKLGVSAYLVEHAPFLVVKNGNTALTILSACITGLISMMVFSFSMVMVLLNQASTSYSPRLLPGLISDKNHQIILGTYIFTILYCIFIAVSVQPTGDEYQVPGFPVLLGILFTVICIWAFIYFIHNISQSIQINNILDRIYTTAKNKLEELIKTEKESAPKFPDTSGWHEYMTEKSGYFQNISATNLIDICEKYETRLEILPPKGIFILKGVPILKSKKKLEEKVVQEIFSNLIFSRGELVSENYALAFKQITEIIVKAMSPGINDPGTALNGIDYLSELFALRMQKRDMNVFVRDEKTFIKMSHVSFAELIYNVLASIRTYCKHDVIIVQKLSVMIEHLQSCEAAEEKYYHSIEREARSLIEDAERNIENKNDLQTVQRLSKKLNLSS
ncbi:MAG: DUF2254 domain-containing protein [Salegentibacter sp.]